MALTVDSLLAAESSSEDDEEGQEPIVASAAAAALAVAGRPADDDDDEEEERKPQPLPKIEVEERAESDQGSELSQDPHVTTEQLASLDEALAMDSDSSAEGGHQSQPLEGLVKKIQSDKAALSSRAQEEAFMRAPFEWCLEHERRLLAVSSRADAEAADYDRSGTYKAEAEKLLATMVEAKSCTELERRAQEFGRPTCVAAQARSIAVGTLRGVVVFLDAKVQDVVGQPEILQPSSPEDAVPVSAIAFSPDGSSMLVGHKHGQLVLWELSSQRAVHVLKDAHSTAVLAVGFWQSGWQHALSADSSGCALVLSYGSSFGQRTCSKSLLFDQSSQLGNVLRVAPLPMVPQSMEHPADLRHLVALCATNATLLLQMHPSTHLLKRMQYHTKDAAAQATWVPDVVWLRPSPEMREWATATATGTQEPCDPLLCIAFGQKVHIMRVSFNAQAKPKEEFTISLVQTFIWGVAVQTVVAFSDGVLGLLDSANKLNIVQLPEAPPEADAKVAAKGQSLTAIHVEDVSAWSVVYHTHTSSASSTAPGQEGRSRHPALAVLRRGRTLYVCGMKEVWSIRIDRWGQRIEDLVKKDKWGVAAEVFIGLHKGNMPPLLDFPVAMPARQRAAGLRATQFLQSYLSSHLEQGTAKSQVRRMCYMAVSACVEMGLWSSLYKTVFECFKASGHMSIYCNMLEPFIVHGRIPRGKTDSEVLSSIMQSYQVNLSEEEQLARKSIEASGQADDIDCDHYPELFPIARRLQQLVLYVDVSQLDLNLAIRLFTQHRMWTALVHVHCSLKDFVTPLELLAGECAQVTKRAQPPRNGYANQPEAALLEFRLVRKLFFFLHRCFELKPFPFDAEEMGGHGTAAAPSSANLGEMLTCILKPAMVSGTAGDHVRAPPMFLRLLRLSAICFFRCLAVLYTSQSASQAVQSLGANDGVVLPGSGHPMSLKNLFMEIEAAVEASKLQAAADGQPLSEQMASEFLLFTARAAMRGGGVTLSQERCTQVVEHILSTAAGEACSGEGGAVPSSSSTFPAFQAVSEAEQLAIGVLMAQTSVEKDNQRFLDNNVIRCVELLCLRQPDQVLKFLTEHEALPLRECLELCRKHSVTDACVYLLERTGDFSAILELLLKDYGVALDHLGSAFASASEATKSIVKRLAAAPQQDGIQGPSAVGADSPEPWFEGFPEGKRCIDIIENASELSARNSNLMTADQLEELWFGMLGSTVRCQEKLHKEKAQASSRETSKRQGGHAKALALMSSQVVGGVLAYLSLPRALRKVASEFQSSPLAVWKDPLQQMLSGLSFQEGLLSAAKDVSAQDVMKPFLAMKRQGSRGVRHARD